MKHVWSCLSIFCVLLLSGCEHKELCMEHPHLVPVRVETEWNKFGELPMNMTVLFFPQDTSEVIHIQNYNPRSAKASLPVNTYDVVVHNELMNELGGIKFRNINNFSSAEAYACDILAQYSMTKSAEEPVVADPERLGIAIIRNFEVTQEMLETYWYQRDMGLQIEENVLKVSPENKVYTIEVKIHARGVQYVRTVDASLSGLSEGYMMHSDMPSTQRVTHLIKNWQKVSTSDTDPDAGYLRGTCLSFGLPSNHTAEAAQNILSMTVLLVDNETVMDYVFQVGNRFRTEQSNYNPTLRLEIGKSGTDHSGDIGYNNPNEPIVFPKVKPEGTMDGGLVIDPSFDGDHSIGTGDFNSK